MFSSDAARGHAGLLQLDDHQAQAVDDADQIAPAAIERTGDAALADQQETNVRRLLPIHDAQPLRFLAATFNSQFAIWRKISSGETTEKCNGLGTFGESRFNLHSSVESNLHLERLPLFAF